MDQDFLFIQESGAGPQAVTTRSQIRTYVMDRVMAQKRAAKPPDDEDHRQQQKRAFSPNKRGRRRGGDNNITFWLRDQHPMNSNSAFLNTVEDMLRLSGAALEINTQTKFLLYHFLHHRSRSLCTVTADTGWLTYALRDPALFNSTMYHWASLNYDFLPTEFQSQANMLQLRGAAISLTNGRLNSIQRGGVSDEAIASVACLANVTLMLGDIDEARIHFKGLNAIVRSRRGVNMLGYHGLIARLVKWTDLYNAQLSNTELSFQEDDTMAAENHSQPSSTLPLKSPFQLSESEVIHRIRNFSVELIHSPRESLSTERRVNLGLRLLASDRDLLSQIHNSSSSLLSIVATAALLYSQAILRGIKCTSRVIKTLLDQVRESVTSALTSEDDVFAEDHAALAWVLLVGVLASGKDTPQSAWFIWCLRRSCGSEGRLPWEEEVQQIIDAPNHMSPKPFLWIFNDDVLRLSSLNTRFHVDEFIS